MKIFPLILLSILSAVDLPAATVSWAATFDTGLIDSTGAALAVGNYVRIGSFSSDSFVQSNLGSVALLDSGFTQFASGKIGAGTSSNTGSFSLSSSNTYGPTPPAYAGTQIYLWSLKSTDTTTLASALATTTQQAIFYVPFAILSGWSFPASDTSPASSLEVADLVNVSAANRKMLAGTYVAGGSTSLNSYFGTPNHAVQLQSVPEPSTVTLGLLAALGAAGWRRRKRK